MTGSVVQSYSAAPCFPRKLAEFQSNVAGRANFMLTNEAAPSACSILGPCYALPCSVGISVVFVGPAVAPVAGQGRYHIHADAICPASWTAPFSYLTGPVARGELAGLAGLRGHAVRLMKRRGRHGLGGSCDGQNKSNSDQPDHCHLHYEPSNDPSYRTDEADGSWFSLRS